MQNREIPDSCYLSGKSPCPRQQGQAQAHPSDRICRRIPCFFLEKEERGQRLCRCPRTFAAIGIMTDSFPCRVRKKWPFSVILGPVGLPGGNGYGIYRRKLNSLDKETIIQLFLAQQEQLRTDRPKPPACTGAAGRPEKTPFRQVNRRNMRPRDRLLLWSGWDDRFF